MPGFGFEFVAGEAALGVEALGDLVFAEDFESEFAATHLSGFVFGVAEHGGGDAFATVICMHDDVVDIQEWLTDERRKTFKANHQTHRCFFVEGKDDMRGITLGKFADEMVFDV